MANINVTLQNGQPIRVEVGENTLAAANSAAAAAASATAAAASAANAGSTLTSVSLFPGRGNWMTWETRALGAIQDLRLYGTNPAKFYFVKFLFWKDVGTRFNLTISEADDLNGTNVRDVCLFVVADGGGAGAWNTAREITLAATGGSGITGVAFVDFTDTAAMGVYAPDSDAVYLRRRISPAANQSSAVRNADIDARISAAAAAAIRPANDRLPFADGCTAVPIRNLIRSIRVYNGRKSSTYAVSVCTVESFAAPLTRFRLTIRDITLGRDACSVAVQVSSQPGFAAFVATLPSIVKLNDASVSVRERIFAVVELNWAAVSDFFSYGDTTVAGAGISPLRIYDDADQADYLQSDHADEVILCGAGQTFTTLRAAVESTYSSLSGTNEVNGAPVCDRACYHHRVRIVLTDDATYNATLVRIPDFVELQGNGKDRTFILRENTNQLEVIACHHNTKLLDLTIRSDTGTQYCIHSDDFNRNVLGGVAQRRLIRQAFKRIRMVGGTEHNGFLFGGGLSAGQHIILEDVDGEFVNAPTSPSNTCAEFFWHNTGPTLGTPSIEVGVKPSLVEMRRCNAASRQGVYLQSLHAAGISIFSVDAACNLGTIRHEIPAGEIVGPVGAARVQWDIVGRHDGPFINFDPDAGAAATAWNPSAVRKRRVTNNSGVSIPAGSFIRFTGATTVALCGAGQRPEGWAQATIANGAVGFVNQTREIRQEYIANASSGSGDWGVNASGQLDYAATPRLGRTVGSVVQVLP